MAHRKTDLLQGTLACSSQIVASARPRYGISHAFARFPKKSSTSSRARSILSARLEKRAGSQPNGRLRKRPRGQVLQALRQRPRQLARKKPLESPLRTVELILARRSRRLNVLESFRKSLATLNSIVRSPSTSTSSPAPHRSGSPGRSPPPAILEFGGRTGQAAGPQVHTSRCSKPRLNFAPLRFLRRSPSFSAAVSHPRLGIGANTLLLAIDAVISARCLSTRQLRRSISTTPAIAMQTSVAPSA